MDITGPVVISTGYEFSLKVENYVECSDAPAASYSVPQRCIDAIDWTKQNIPTAKIREYPINYTASMSIVIPDLANATVFKLRWV